MAKQALPGKRLNMFGSDPNEFTVVTKAWMAEQGIEEHPLYDERGEWEPEEKLVLNVMELGVIEPIVVTKEGDFVLIVDGRQRWNAVMEANRQLAKRGEETLTIRAITTDDDAGGLMSAMISLNKLRRDNDILTDARQAADLLKRKSGDHKAVAVVSGVGVQTVKFYVKLNSLDEKVKNAIRKGQLSATDAVQHLSELAPHEQRAKLKELLASGTEGESEAAEPKRIKRDAVRKAFDPNAIAKPPAKLIKRVIASDALPQEFKILLQWRDGKITEQEALQALPQLAAAMAEPEAAKAKEEADDKGGDAQ